MTIIFAAAWGLAILNLLDKRRWVAAVVAFGAGLFWLAYSPSLINWFLNLGSDSFSEAQNFDFNEAVDYVKSLTQVLRPRDRAAVAVFAVGGFLAGLGIYTAARRPVSSKKWPFERMIAPIAWLTISTIVVGDIAPAVRAFRSNSDYYEKVFANFHAGVDRDSFKRADHTTEPRPLNVIVYIGESTSSMNMSIYGYPRPTTPQLSALQAEQSGFIKFDDVFSTHAHTAPSLLEALSIGRDREHDILPIDERSRFSIVDVLRSAGVPVALVSNQGSAGVWNNIASTVIFNNADTKEFSFKSALTGDLDHWVERPLDHEVFTAFLTRHSSLASPGPKAIFLHSYAGHGPYLRSIDKGFRGPIDDYLARQAEIDIVGSNMANAESVVRTIEEYDSAIRYIDHSIAMVIKEVASSVYPAVFLYFSDHGEAVYAGRRHDSSRFLHEMARVPFIVYFNEAAQRSYPDTFELIRRASKGHNFSSLAQFPATLFALLGLDGIDMPYSGIGLDPAHVIPPILIRKTSEGYTYVSLSSFHSRRKTGSEAQDVTDSYTSLYWISRSEKFGATDVCQYGSDTVGKALRGALTADCLWVSITVGKDGKLKVGEGVATKSDFDLGAVLAIAKGFEKGLWISSDDLARPLECEMFDQALQVIGLTKKQGIFVTFPAGTDWRDTRVRACINSLREKGVHTALDVSEHLSGKSGIGGLPVAGDSRACKVIQDGIGLDSSDKVFDYLGLDWVSSMATTTKAIARAGCGASWTAWRVPVSDLNGLDADMFSVLAVDMNEDPNSR